MNLLVTGGAGYIGSHAVIHLAADSLVGESMTMPDKYCCEDCVGLAPESPGWLFRH